MPQITINEIDQSIYRRVINDDKVKVLIPGIASFGPVFDGETDSARSFTDITPFRKTFGYTEPEYNPFKNDVSRLYASQLIDRGAEVSFIRMNEGETASLMDRDAIPEVVESGDISGDETEQAAKKKAIAESASAKFGEIVGITVATDATTGLPTDTNITATESTSSNTYTVTLKSTVYYKGYGFQFSDYIQAIKAKWSGSFGNNLLLTFTPVSTKNREFSAQYSLVGVYRVEKTKESDTTFTYKDLKTFLAWIASNDVTVDVLKENGLTKFYYNNGTADVKKVFTQPSDADWQTYATTKASSITLATTTPASGEIVLEEGKDYYVSRTLDDGGASVSYHYDGLIKGKRVVETTNTKTVVTINKVHMLENHVITTNPNDKNYFEDVEFEFIEFEATDGARDKLTLLWSNISIPASGITDTLSEMNGFPEITLRVRDENGIGSHFNSSALMTDGYDFVYSDETKAKLDIMYNGVATATGASIIGQTGSEYTIEDVNRYLFDAYSHTGVCARVFDAINNCYMNYTDPYIYDFDFITSGGFNSDIFLIAGKNSDTTVYVNDKDSFSDAKTATTNYNTDVWIVSSGYDVDVIPNDLLLNHAAMRELVTTRKDCIALLDVMPNWLPDLLTTYVGMVNTSYCTFHAPWGYCTNPNDGTLVLMPPSFIFLYTMLSNLINNVESQKWFPPAGVTRATARVMQKPQYEIGSVILNKWQNDTLSRVNPIMKLKQFGYVIYGQYTAYMAPDEFTHSALESLNVRLIANCVKKQIFTTCMKLTFEPNNSRLWLTFYDAMDKYLSFMKRNGGLYDYKIEMNESTVTTDDINELRCPGKVWINPTRTAEFFDIDFIITDAGVTFTED